MHSLSYVNFYHFIFEKLPIFFSFHLTRESFIIIPIQKMSCMSKSWHEILMHEMILENLAPAMIFSPQEISWVVRLYTTLCMELSPMRIFWPEYSLSCTKMSFCYEFQLVGFHLQIQPKRFGEDENNINNTYNLPMLLLSFLLQKVSTEFVR